MDGITCLTAQPSAKHNLIVFSLTNTSLTNPKLIAAAMLQCLGNNFSSCRGKLYNAQPKSSDAHSEILRKQIGAGKGNDNEFASDFYL